MTDYSLVFKGLSSPTRIQILKLLKEETLCACEILEKFKITQPTLSHHMKILCDSKLVLCKKNGLWTNYSLNKKIIDKIVLFFDALKVKGE